MTVREPDAAPDDSIAADQAGLSRSAWQTVAAEDALATDRGLAAVAEWEAEHGELTAEELAGADLVVSRVLDGPDRRAS